MTLVEACLEQIGARPEINAFIERFDRQALAEARTAEREIQVPVVTAGLCTAFRCSRQGPDRRRRRKDDGGVGPARDRGAR